MNTQKVLLYYRKVNTGGSETLLLRYGHALVKKGVQVTLLCNSAEPVMKYQFENCRIDVKVDTADSDKFLAENIRVLGSKDLILCLGIDNFLRCEYIKKRIGSSARNILYVVHPFSLFAANNKKKYINVVKKTLMRIMYSKPIKRYLQNGNIVFMDEQCFEYNNKFYKYSKGNIDQYILRLPIDTTVITNEWLENKAKRRKEAVELLTVARASFPFKGYMKGLIELYSSLKDSYQINLTIVSDRDDFETLEKWVNRENSSSIKKIRLIHGLKYDDLVELYRKCHIYIGMGTTILEAADKGAISIPISAYTYECNGTLLFSEAPQLLVAEIGGGKSIRPVLEKILKLNDTAFINLMSEARNAVINYYSTDNFIIALDNRHIINSSSYVSIFTIAFLNILRALR